MPRYTTPAARARTVKFKVEDVCAAYAAAGGIHLDAARILAKKLKQRVSRKTLENYAGTVPAVQAAIAEAKEATLDLAESELLKMIRSGDFQAIKFYLETIGKVRGYTRAMVINGQAVPQNLMDMVTNARKDLDDEYDAMAARLGHEPGGNTGADAPGTAPVGDQKTVH